MWLIMWVACVAWRFLSKLSALRKRESRDNKPNQKIEPLSYAGYYAGDKGSTKDDRQSVSSPLDVCKTARAVDVAPAITENSRQDMVII